MALIAAHLNAGHSGGDSVAIGVYSPSSPTSIPPSPPFSPSPISLMVSVDVKHHVYFAVWKSRWTSGTIFALRPQKRGGLSGTGGGGGGWRKSEGSTADTARKRPERPRTAARTMEVLRRCPLAIAQRLVHRASAVSTAVLRQSHKDNVRCTAVEEQLEAKEVQLPQPSSTSLPMISSGLTWRSGSTFLL